MKVLKVVCWNISIVYWRQKKKILWSNRLCKAILIDLLSNLISLTITSFWVNEFYVILWQTGLRYIFCMTAFSPYTFSPYFCKHTPYLMKYIGMLWKLDPFPLFWSETLDLLKPGLHETEIKGCKVRKTKMYKSFIFHQNKE